MHLVRTTEQIATAFEIAQSNRERLKLLRELPDDEGFYSPKLVDLLNEETGMKLHDVISALGNSNDPRAEEPLLKLATKTSNQYTLSEVMQRIHAAEPLTAMSSLAACFISHFGLSQAAIMMASAPSPPI